jgi:hypothetical protein
MRTLDEIAGCAERERHDGRALGERRLKDLVVERPPGEVDREGAIIDEFPNEANLGSHLLGASQRRRHAAETAGLRDGSNELSADVPRATHGSLNDRMLDAERFA